MATLQAALVLATALAAPAWAERPEAPPAVGPNVVSGPRRLEAPDFATLPELKPVREGRTISEQSADGKAKLYWKVNSIGCSGGGRVYIAVDGKWKGYVSCYAGSFTWTIYC